MYSYYEGGIRTTAYGTQISFDIFQSLIKSNPHSDKIEVLRKLEYGSEAYKKLKLKHPFPAMKPHGIFLNRNKKEILQKLSGYLYFDIDAADIQTDANLYKEFLLQEYSEYISMLGKSIGGKGVFFLVKVKGLTENNFNQVYEYFRMEVFANLPIDNNAKGIARNFFIPSDENLYSNKNIITDITDIIKDIISNNNEVTINKECKSQGGTDIKECKEEHNAPDFYTYTHIPIDSFWDSIILKSSYQVIDNVADVIQRKFYVVKRRKIKDGCKHRTFPVMIWTFMLLNPHLTLNHITSYMLWFNKNYTNSSPMLTNKLIAMVQNCYKNYDEEKVPFKLKSLWLNPKLAMGRRAKVRLCNSINAEIRKGKSVEKIMQAMREMIAEGLEMNKTQIAKRAGISRQSVNNHWEECMAQFAALPEPLQVIEHKHTLKAIKGKLGAVKELIPTIEAKTLTRHEYLEQFDDAFKSQGELYRDYLQYLKSIKKATG